jgi:hypothetical protein
MGNSTDAAGNFSILLELQKVLSDPYAEQSDEMQEKYCRMKPLDTFGAGGVSWCSARRRKKYV